MNFSWPRKLSPAVSLALAATLALATPPTVNEKPRQETPSQASEKASNIRPVKSVVAISIDGLNPEAIRRLGPEQAPTLHRLMSEGASTLNARTEVERTVTLPNHTGMLTSRRIDPAKRGHGVSFNDDNARTTVHRAANHYVASVFDVVHDRGKTTALYSAKAKFALFSRTWNRDGRKDKTGAANGRQKIDRVLLADSQEDRLTKAVVNDARNGLPVFTFWHIGASDAAGHASGWLSPRYMASVKQADKNIGKLIAEIENNPRLASTTVLITADHGGVPNTRSHDNGTKAANYTVPFIAWGQNVAAGKNLYRLNQSKFFKNPLNKQLPYSGKQPVRNAMIGNTALKLLGLPAIPGSELNRRQNLRLR